MAASTVILTPGASYSVTSPTLNLSDGTYPDDQWTARVSLDIAAAILEAPVLLVLAGAAAVHAPGLGFAQRSARRAVAGYALVDPVLPAVGGDWPDAPVTVILTPYADADTRSAALGARLRGWEVLDGDPARTIDEIAARP